METVLHKAVLLGWLLLCIHFSNFVENSDLTKLFAGSYKPHFAENSTFRFSQTHQAASEFSPFVPAQLKKLSFFEVVSRFRFFATSQLYFLIYTRILCVSHCFRFRAMFHTLLSLLNKNERSFYDY